MGAAIHRSLTSRRLKGGAFAIETLNAFSTTYFYYLIYFYLRDQFGFGILQNLILAAAIGAAYAVSAILGGRFAQRFGYFTSIQWGAGLMAASFLIGSQINGLAGTMAVIFVGNAGLCLTWPALQALVSEGESAIRLQSMLGIYNVVWAGAGAVAYFTGGYLQQHFGPKSIFYVPAGILILETLLAVWLEKAAAREPQVELDPPLLAPEPEGRNSPLPPALFLKMAWLANPLAYLAVNTVISSLPTVAAGFHFSVERAGFVCSIWLFARAASFILLRLWPRWHYRFRFMAGAYVAMFLSFAGILLGPNVPIFVASQILFGLSIGLIYYSSIFYSMDVGETKGKHGGIHEGAIGAGNAVGPGIAALALVYFPGHPGSGTAAVCALLIGGLGVLYWMRYGVPAKSARTISGDA